jgi:mono/diheme cytochrome c family protein
MVSHPFERTTMKQTFGTLGLLGLFLVPIVALAAQDKTADVERGKAVYTEQKCSLCHAIEGKGNKQNPLDGVGDKVSAADMRKWITSPKEMEAALATKPKISMKAYTNLKPADLDALVAYLQTLKKS